MLNITFIRENKAIIEQACANKQLDPKVVEQLLEVDKKRKDLQQEIDQLRSQVNTNSDQVKKQVHLGDKPSPELIEEGKVLKIKLKEIEPSQKEIEQSFKDLMYQIPNVPAPDVPVGKDENSNKVIRAEGDLPRFDFTPLPHEEVMLQQNMLEVKRAVGIGGFRSYFLKGQGVMLENAILRYALETMIRHGFTPLTVPVLVNEEAMWGTGYFPWGEEDHYKTQDGQFLAGTAEVALTAFHQGETLAEKDLPIKMVGISPCFRREVGSYGKDTKGIVRVHQFNKVEQVVYTIADEEETRKWHDRMLGFSEELLRGLELPYRILLMCSGDMGAGQRKKYDIETWFPAQRKYRETHSASYFNDFQSRRLGIKYQAKDGSTKFVYTLNNTVAATPRLLAALVENHQQKDGSIRIPRVLEKFV